MSIPKKDPTLSSLSTKGLSFTTLYIEHLSLIYFLKKDPTLSSLFKKKKSLSNIIYCTRWYISSISFSKKDTS